MSKRAGIYVRISLDRDGLSASPERQEADARKLCEQRGWQVVDVYVDRDTSAFKRSVKRPEYSRLKNDVKDGTINAVVVWKLDRLSRSVRDFSDTLDFLDGQGADLASVQDPIDTSSAMGKAMIQIAAVFAELESATIGTRVKRSQQQRAEEGKAHGGGHRSFGYLRDGTIVEDEAAQIREAAAKIIDGDSLWSIAKAWNEAGVRTTAGNEWASSSVSQMFRSVKLAGFVQNGDETYEGSFDAILDLDTFRAVQDQMAKGRRTTEKKVKRHLLTGIITCGRCGASLLRRKFTQKNGTAFERYQCVKQPGRPGCGKTAVTMAGCDEAVTAKVLQRWSLVDNDQVSDVDTDADEVRAQLDEDKAALEQVTRERFIEKSMSDSIYQEVRATLEERIETLESDLDRLQSQSTTLLAPTDEKALLTWWNDATREQQRALIEQTVETIALNPAKQKGGNKFDPDRLAISWRI